MSKFISRKEIALILGVSVDSVRRNEKPWGLSEYRVNLNARLVLYWRTGVMKLFRDRRWVNPP